MSEDPTQPIKHLDRTLTTTSRFTEQLSDSTEQDYRDDAGSHAPEIAKRLKLERERQRKAKSLVRRKSESFKIKFASERSRRMSGQTALAYERRRSIARSMVKSHKANRKNRQRHEKQHKQKSRLIGAVWGYDPMAGRTGKDTKQRGCYMFRGMPDDSDEYGEEEIDALGRRTGRLWLRGSKWGIEYGGPSRAPNYEKYDVRPLRSGDSSGRSRSNVRSHSPRV